MSASLVALALALAPSRPAAEVDFERDIAPIFAAKCLSCHGPEKQRSGYRLDVKSIALSGGELSAPNIHPGDANSSALYRYVSGADPEMEMPPRGEPLNEAEIALVRRWIDEGAAWPDTASVAVADPLDWWSLRPIARPRVPSNDANPIDAFVRARLADAGLAMAPEADARTLLRRVSFDLTGLPPTPEEIDAFVAEQDPRKYE
ncbi:MAG: DUF1549 domain-containing protein, partial [bacterium]